MIEIRKFKDIAKIQDNHQALRGYVNKLFLKLHRALEPALAVHQFDLSDVGYIVVLERGDDIRNLSEIGLSPINKGLLGVIPEAVTAIKMKDGKMVYQAELLFNNEFLLYILFFEDDFDKEIQEWIKNFCGEGVGV